MIVFAGSTILSSTNSLGYKLTPSSIQKNIIKHRAPLGSGYWIKDNGYDAANLILEISWHGTSSIITTVEALQNSYGTLYFDDYGTFENCRLENIAPWQIEKSDADYIISTTLTFVQYPRSS